MRGLAIILLFGFLCQTISKLAIIINYQVNKEYIAQNLCVNKDEPESCCEGKCHLEKELKKADEAESTLPGSDIKEKLETFSCLDNNFFKGLISVSSIITYSFPICPNLNQGYEASVFHPPSC